MGAFTVSVNGCVALGVTPFCAVKVGVNVPLTVGVPLKVAVPLPLFTNVTPAGSVPDDSTLGVGVPEVDIVNAPNKPWVNVTLFALVNVGATPVEVTVKVNGWVAFGLTPLLAVNTIELNTPLAVGVPLNVPIPLPLSTYVTPVGSAPASAMAGTGLPVVVTLKVLNTNCVNVALFVLVIAGGAGGADVLYTRVNVCNALGETPFAAV